ncbi:golgin subfamily A member 6-like protein 22 isoform X2 [Myripristis murdjan]|uniref:golgin subfamily A member 6-like protein 22 isoform X2 n=1 Tax=Myripristis murdjan TaxID=586833 RepID=UPI0011760DA6|nr:golgin subfamily A member 6-like protein 22 isoform X2 [Myripristis murdjan]
MREEPRSVRHDLGSSGVMWPLLPSMPRCQPPPRSPSCLQTGLQHPALLPSMPLCQHAVPPACLGGPDGRRDVSPPAEPPDGLIAPLSPRLAEEEEEEEEEEDEEDEGRGLFLSDPYQHLRGNKQSRLQVASRKSLQSEGRRQEATRRSSRTGGDERRRRACHFCGWSFSGESHMMHLGERVHACQVCRESSAHLVGHTRKREEEEEEEGGNTQLDSQVTEQPRKRRTVGPPIRYLLESEEQLYAPTAANHIRARGFQVRRGRARLRSGEDRRCGEEAETGGAGVVDGGAASRRQQGHDRAQAAEDRAQVSRRCQVCGSELQRHLVAHSGGRRLTCDLCNRFTHDRGLRLHQLRYHSERGGRHGNTAARNRSKEEEDGEEKEMRIWTGGEREEAEERSGDGLLEPAKAHTQARARRRYPAHAWSWISRWSRHERTRHEEQRRRRRRRQGNEQERRRRRCQDNVVKDMEGVCVMQEEREMQEEENHRMKGDKEGKLRPGCLKEVRKRGGGGGGDRVEEEVSLRQPGQRPTQQEEETKLMEQPGRPRRKTVGPPIRYLLESEEPSHGLVIANHVRGGGERVDEGVSLRELRQRPEEEEEEKLKETKLMEQPLRPRRTTVGPPIRYLLESEEPSHGLLPTNHIRGGGKEVSPTQPGQRPAEEEEKEREKEEETKLSKQPERPRRRTVGPPVRYLLESEEPSHGLVTANHIRGRLEARMEEEVSPTQPGQRPEEEETKLMEQSERPRRKMVAPPIRYLLQSEEPSHGLVTANHVRGGGESIEEEVSPTQLEQRPTQQEEETKLMEQPGRPRRKTVGPPIRYLLESEEPSHGLVIANHIRGGGERVDEGVSLRELRRRPEEEEEEEKLKETKLMEQPLRPRRTTVGPPIRYLLESEEPSHGLLPANHVRGGGKEVSPTQPGQRPAEEEEREKEEETKLSKQPERPRRRTVGPPVRYLLESEEPSHGLVIANHVRGGGARVDEGVSLRELRQRPAEEEEEKDEEETKLSEQPLRPRRKTVGPPIRYLLESEEPSHGLLPANHVQVDGHEVTRKRKWPKKKSTGQTSVMYTDTWTGQEVLIVPCSVWLQCLHC